MTGWHYIVMVMINHIKQTELERLVSGTRQGDERAFEELVRIYQNLAYGYAFALLKDLYLAQDAVQDSFLAAYYQLHSLKEIAAFPGWLRGIVRHKCLRILRKQKARTVPLEEVTMAADSENRPDNQFERKELNGHLMEAVSNLRQDQREIVCLFYIEEHSQDEVARFLGIPKSTVNNRLHAARQTLKRRMFAMVKDKLGRSGLPDDFAETIGRIIRVQGPVVEVEMKSGVSASLFDSWKITDRQDTDGPVLSVIQRDVKGRIRLVSEGESAFLKDGAQIRAEMSSDLPRGCDAMLADIAAAIRPRAKEKKILATGIKIIDLLSPLPAEGTVGLFGAQGTGQAVFVMELYKRLKKREGRLAIFYFVSQHQASNLKHVIEREPNFPADAEGPLETSWLITNDAADPCRDRTYDFLDAAIYFSPLLSCRDIYPAIDSLYSSSTLMNADILGKDHVETAKRVRDIVGKAREISHDAKFHEYVALGAYKRARQHIKEMQKGMADGLSDEQVTILARARKLELYFSQPFHVAESFTGVTGKDIAIEDTISDCRAILDGDADDIPEKAFVFTGNLREIRNQIH
jgi:RNA polymerase sigma factor (sigma-70 family)